MRITQLTLTDFVPHADSGLSKLTIDFTEDVQIWLGTNGGGKSATQRNLSPYPTPRSMFGKSGHKTLTIETEGHCFTLESDYQKPSSPHLFTDMDTEENLNIGRTTEEQKELIHKKLGITPFIDSLMMNTINFPKMKPAQRKEFLMAHNPDDIGFVLGLAKQTSSKIRACKNTLSHLQSRKILLEQELLSPEVIVELEQERDQISEDLGHFQQSLMDIEVATRTVPSTPLPSVYDIKAIKTSLRGIRYAMVDLQMIERDDDLRSQIKDRLTGQSASYNDQQFRINEQIIAQTHDLHDLEVQYKELAPDGDLQEAESVVSRLEAERDRFKTQQPDFEISKSSLEQGYQFLDRLQEALSHFERCEIPLYPRKKRAHREQVQQQAQYRQSSYRMQRNDLQSQFEDLSKRHTLKPSDIPEDNCAKDACPLYSHFMAGYQDTERKRQEAQHRIQRLSYKLKRIDQYLELSHQYFEQSRFYHEKITWIVDQSRNNPILHKVLTQLDVLSTLSSTPNRIALRLKDEYDHIEQWMRYKSILNDLETAYSLRDRFLGSQSADTVKLVVTIDNLKKTLQGLRNDLDQSIVNKRSVEDQLEKIHRYETLKKTALDIRNTHIGYMELLSNNHERQCLSFLKTKIEELRQQRFLRMSDVERTLRAQSGLHERYQEDYVSQIERIEKEKSDQERIEKALIAIPRENTISFVNGIFEQANLLIDLIWTVPFKIDLLKESDPLDYTFQVSGDNDSVREMSECSEGQTEILYLAINLALRIQLGHVNIPLCLDETGRTFDTEHKRRLIMVLKKLLDDKVISQLFYISHDLNLVSSLGQAEYFVIKDTNIMVPQEFNLHCTMQ